MVSLVVQPPTTMLSMCCPWRQVTCRSWHPSVPLSFSCRCFGTLIAPGRMVPPTDMILLDMVRQNGGMVYHLDCISECVVFAVYHASDLLCLIHHTHTHTHTHTCTRRTTTTPHTHTHTHLTPHPIPPPPTHCRYPWVTAVSVCTP